MPPARLHPLPFPDPERLSDLVFQDPTLLEPGLRVVGRDVPVPSSAGGGVLIAIAADARGRACAVRAAASAGAADLNAALATSVWLKETLPTLRALCPALDAGDAPPRCLIVAGRVEPGADALWRSLAEPKPEIFLLSLFEGPLGLAVSIQPAAAAHPAAPAPGKARAEADPLSGIPLTTEEYAEFRRLSTPGSHRAAAASVAPSRPRARAYSAPRAWPEGRDAFLEN